MGERGGGRVQLRLHCFLLIFPASSSSSWQRRRREFIITSADSTELSDFIVIRFCSHELPTGLVSGGDSLTEITIRKARNLVQETTKVDKVSEFCLTSSSKLAMPFLQFVWQIISCQHEMPLGDTVELPRGVRQVNQAGDGESNGSERTEPAA